MLSESAARWLLVLHTALGVATVAAATHLVVWMRGYLRGDFARHRAVRRFAWIVLALHGGTFVVGNTMYPTYKVEVRAAYLENANAVATDVAAHRREVEHVAAREGATVGAGAATIDLVRRAAQTARWFDIKEHWVALGWFVAAALVLVVMLWDPRRDGGTIAPIVVGLATIEAATVWLAAIIGVLAASWRAV